MGNLVKCDKTASFGSASCCEHAEHHELEDSCRQEEWCHSNCLPAEIEWYVFHEFECNHCGSDDVRVKTTCANTRFVADGDEAKCGDCGQLGGVSVNEDGVAHINWHSEDCDIDCQCAWCKEHPEE